jgi:hypothetical protein
MSGHPYRASDGPPPKFICVSCYRTASSAAGICSRCGAPRVSVDNDQVRDDVRAYVERTQQRATSRRLTLTVVASTALAITLYVLLVGLGVVDAHQPHRFRHLPVNDAVFFPLWIACMFGGALLVERVARGRRARIDAAMAAMPDLLAWLGVHVDG